MLRSTVGSVVILASLVGMVSEDGDGIYAEAACQVHLWMIAHGGTSAVPALLAKLHDGAEFDSHYKP
jgi:hypothetical protein